MDFSVKNGYSQTIPRPQQPAAGKAQPQPDTSKANDNTPLPVVYSPATSSRSLQSGTRLVSENNETIGANGFRRTATYEREDGRRFFRMEELSLTTQGARRTVTQQNPSGSISVYEEVLDRQDSGAFRRTQRFQDGTGDISTQVTEDYTVTDPFILSGGKTAFSYISPAAFQPMRGTQLDLRA
ncbi:MAG: hypothetical protein DI626_07095 [Micavibrio aeruginosavorus]|uniref:Uncharacterized protein n=1 Tax=Micavibrio aeruginosavorus TaxID=349221 RepID=A0A2W5BVW3_9BACT|nr:MAG: hypothetical protein DI626_07095 [Micavibrio aeruginosavorus]